MVFASVPHSFIMDSLKRNHIKSVNTLRTNTEMQMEWYWLENGDMNLSSSREGSCKETPWFLPCFLWIFIKHGKAGLLPQRGPLLLYLQRGWTELMPLSSHQNSNSGSTSTIFSQAKISYSKSIPWISPTLAYCTLPQTCMPRIGPATNFILRMKEGLHILAIYSLYTESHAISYTRTRLLGNFKVNQILDATLEKEEGYIRSFCTTVEVDNVYRTALNHNTT